MRKLKLAISEMAAGLAWKLIYQKRQAYHSWVPILCYHRVLPDFLEDEEDPIYTVLPEQFEAQMAFLAREGYDSLTLQEFAEITRGLKPPGRRPVIITFDDGYADIYAVAWRLARKYGLKLNLFVTTGFIGRPEPLMMTQDGYYFETDVARNPKNSTALGFHIKKYPDLWRPLNWQEIREMREDGIGIGLHGHSHRNFARLGPEEIEAEIASGQAAFKERLGMTSEFFALPYGWHDSYRPETLLLFKRFQVNYLFGTHMGRVRLPRLPEILPRLLIYQQDSLETFQHKLRGAYDFIEPLRLFWHRVKRLLLCGPEKSVQ
jgi:peptidoglycan/xylan/chitin deacetylase (PgdA/CDA1 family)